MTEVPLTGGHITREVVRVGETVRRTSHGTSFAVRVLTYLEIVGHARGKIVLLHRTGPI